MNDIQQDEVVEASPSHEFSLDGSNSDGGKSSWSNSLKELMGLPPPKPPIVPRRKSVEEERDTYHQRNQKFLEQANKVKSTISSPNVTVGKGNTIISPRSGPSPVGSVRKSHHRLESISEAKPKSASESEAAKKAPEEGFNKHLRIHSDEMSALSGSSSVWSRDETDNSSAGTSQITVDHENYATYEELRDAQFAQTKQQLEFRLKRALQNDSTNVMSEDQKQAFVQEYMSELERERASLLSQWRTEWEAERERLDRKENFRQMFSKNYLQPCLESGTMFLASLEVFLANLPLTIGAVGLSWVTMGTVWFKFMEEMVEFCHPVHYYSPQCIFPEYPGCFECETRLPLYQFVLRFHLTCSCVAGCCCVLFILKVIIGWKVVVDELRNPTTSTPMGVVCIATVCVFAGQGPVGEAIVVGTSVFHFFLAFWFLYMAIFRFGLWPDPGWFPNTVGLTYAAVKSFLYFPKVGLFFLIFAVLFFFSTFFVSVVRVALNNKIAAPIAWIGLSAPSITMYALTLVSQPLPHFETEIEGDATINTEYHHWMARYYLPFQHLMMALSVVGLISAVCALVTRWDAFSKKPFSPAHVAFCFPTLSHTNAVQAYRGAVNAFSSLAPESPYRVALFYYWVAFLVGGTILNLVFSFMYVRRLPRWTKLETAGEEQPPAPEQTFVHEMLDATVTHELLDQPFMSPAVLQANEAGALVRVRRGTADYDIYGPYVRTRRVTALGFDPIMDDEELRRERAELLDWVAKNAPRRRNRTMSNPMFLQSTLANARGGNDDGLYGSLGGGGHKRSMTTTVIPGV
eukprot:Nitzschia sp. Nitz4//scaffold321_size20361//10676//13149//NITZ4_008686-RA/size20361-processed-gene-0.36-mRNA-1//-1//CDS//3329547784//6144//frame0